MMLRTRLAVAILLAVGAIATARTASAQTPAPQARAAHVATPQTHAGMAGSDVAQARLPPTLLRCTPISQRRVAALFDRWNAALKTGNPDAVVREYAPDAVLLPTAENGPLVGRAAIRGYFVHFLERHPQGAIDQQIIHIGCNMAYDAGTYTFTLDGSQPGTRVKLPARFTYIYQPVGGQWLIVHHHSSAMPVQAH